jgi:Transcriptional regulators
MDRLDVRLLRLLQTNGRMKINELSQQLALSRPSVAERMIRLQEQGVIEGFGAKVSLSAIGRGVLLFILMSDVKVPLAEFERSMIGDESILECHRVTGTIGYILKAAVADMVQVTALVDRLIPYGSVHTSIVLHSPLSGRCVEPDVPDK